MNETCVLKNAFNISSFNQFSTVSGFQLGSIFSKDKNVSEQSVWLENNLALG